MRKKQDGASAKMQIWVGINVAGKRNRLKLKKKVTQPSPKLIGNTEYASTKGKRITELLLQPN